MWGMYQRALGMEVSVKMRDGELRRTILGIFYFYWDVQL